MTQHIQRKETESLTRQIDRAFESHKDRVGEGNFADLEPEGYYMTVREGILKIAKKDQNGTVKQRIDRATEKFFNERSAKSSSTPATKPVVSPEEWAAAGLARPTHRAPDEVPGVRKATRNLEAALAERRGSKSEEANGEVDLDDFPG